MAGYVTVGVDDLARVVRRAAIGVGVKALPPDRVSLMRLARQLDDHDVGSTATPYQDYVRGWLTDPRSRVPQGT